MDDIEKIDIGDRVMLIRALGKYPAGAKGLVIDRYNQILPGGNHRLSLRVEIHHTTTGARLDEITVPYGHAKKI